MRFIKKTVITFTGDRHFGLADIGARRLGEDKQEEGSLKE
jgi:hypothetical protein